jgi:hypothetical protein
MAQKCSGVGAFWILDFWIRDVQPVFLLECQINIS